MWYVLVKTRVGFGNGDWNAIDELYSEEQAKQVAHTTLRGGVDVVAINGPEGQFTEYVNDYDKLTVSYERQVGFVG